MKNGNGSQQFKSGSFSPGIDYVLSVLFILMLAGCATAVNKPLSNIPIPSPKFQTVSWGDRPVRVAIRTSFASGTDAVHLKRADRISEELATHLNSAGDSGIDFFAVKQFDALSKIDYDYLLQLSCESPKHETRRNKFLLAIGWPATLSVIFSPLGLISLSIKGVVKESAEFEWSMSIVPKHHEDSLRLKHKQLPVLKSEVSASGWGIPEEVLEQSYINTESHLKAAATEFINGIEWDILSEKVAIYARAHPAQLEKTEIAEQRVKPYLPSLRLSDVDKDIPVTDVKNPNSIAVVIGNRDYKSKDVPSVDYALNDAGAVKKYLINVLGYRAGNIIHKQNASKATFESIFGTREDYKGKLYNYLRKGASDIFIYYSGHGAPDTQDKKGYFVPVDADPETIRLTGYALDQLYENIARIARDKKSPNVYIIIEACFSGSTEKGFLLKNISPVSIRVENPVLAMPNAVVLTSSMGSEVSSWYPEKGHSMFTYFFLKALKEAAEKGKGTTTAEVVFRSIMDETDGLPYYARRLHGRIQTPQIMGDRNRPIFQK